MRNSLAHQFRLARFWVSEHAYRDTYVAWDKPLGKLAVVLFLLDIIFMTRFYALSNLAETLLFFLFLTNSSLRIAFLRTLTDPVVAALMLFFCWTLVSGLWSAASLGDILNDWWGWRKLLLLPIGLVLLSDKKVFVAGCYVLFGVGVAFLTTSIVVWSLDIPVFWGRPYNYMLQNHNAQGLYFAILGSSILMSVRLLKAHWAVRGAFGLLGLAFWIFTLSYGSSRTGYIAVVIAMAIYAFWVSGRLYGLLIGVCIAAAVIYISPTANHRVNLAVNEVLIGLAPEGGQIKSGSIRAVMWKNTIDLIGDNWLLGTGASSFKKEYARVVSDVSGWRGTITDDPHNHFLHIWAEYGLVGVLFFSAFLIASFCRGNFFDFWGVLLLTILCISCVVGIFNGVFGSPVEGRTIQFGLAFCLSGLTNDFGLPKRRWRYEPTFKNT